MSQFDIIATINNKAIKEEDLKKLIAAGATIIRLNGAFLDLPTLPDDIKKFRAWIGSSARILVDLPGYKLRLANLKGELKAQANVPFELHQNDFNYPDFFNAVAVGDRLRANDGLDSFVITEKTGHSLICKAAKDITLRRGKGVHIDGKSYRPDTNSLSQLDRNLIAIARECDVDYLGLSFVYNVADIEIVENLIKGTKLVCLPKIESKESLNALYDILKKCKIAIVDRGDLAAEIGIKNIWRASRTILSMARLLKNHIIFATQFLNHMIEKPLPSIAEVDSMYDLINQGINGIQLSDEVSVGLYPLEAVSFITEMITQVEDDIEKEPKEARVG